MSILIGFLYVIEVIVCLLLALVVMLQRPKDGGLGGAIAGGMGEAVFGADASNVLIRTTIVLGTVFLINTLALARLTSTVHTKTLMSEVVPAPVQQQMPVVPQMPAAPAAPAATPVQPATAPAPVAAKPVTPVSAPAKPTAKPVVPVSAPAKPAVPAKPAAK